MASTGNKSTTPESITPAVVMSRLRGSHAFEKLRDLLVPTDLLESKVAEVCANYLQAFISDREYREIAESLRLRRRVVSKAKLRLRGDRTARAGLEAVARGCVRGARLAREAAGIRRTTRTLTIDPAGEMSVTVTRNDPAAARLKRDARTLNHLIVDLCVVLYYTTRMSQAGILATAVPSILEALRARFPDDLPKRGLADPEARFKRFMRQSLTTYRRQDLTLTTSNLLRARERILFAKDLRFQKPRGQRRV